MEGSKVLFVAKANQVAGILAGVSDVEVETDEEGDFSVSLVNGSYEVVVDEFYPVGDITVTDGADIALSEIISLT